MMETEREIHAINKKLSEIVASIVLLKERRSNDKEDVKDLSEKVHELSVSINQLNLTLNYKDGQIDGATKTVKVIRMLFGSLIFITIISCVTFMWDVHDRIIMLESFKG